MKLLIKNCKSLLQIRSKEETRLKGDAMKSLPALDNAWLAIENGRIADFGSMDDFPGISDWTGVKVIDAEHKLVYPSYVDSHTHIVFAGSREGEFVDRINGLTYEAIAARGGGILNSAAKMEKASEEELLAGARIRLQEIIRQGTGAVEIKSGYGLSLETELKMLRVIKALKKESPLTIKSTFLGAHAVPVRHKGKKENYIAEIINEILPLVAEEQLADFMDVFCEQNYFTPEETIRLLEAGKKYGLIPKVHAEQLSNFGGVLAGVQVGAISVDHLEYVGEKEIEALKGSQTIPTILPGAAFFLSLPYPPARQMLDAGLPVALASDYNPGSSPSGNMQLMMSLACIQYKMTPAEALNAATLHSACAMGVEEELGSICVGKKANLVISKPVPNFDFIPYAFGSQLIDTVILNGKVVWEDQKVENSLAHA